MKIVRNPVRTGRAGAYKSRPYGGITVEKMCRGDYAAIDPGPIYLLITIIEKEVRYHMNIPRSIITPNWRPGKAAWAGLVATVIYSIAMEGDKFLIGNRFSDTRFIQGLLEGEARTKRFFLLSWIIHLLNGVVLAEFYAAVARRFLPGPNWLRGSIFGEIFIVSAWWLTPLADKYHPLIRNGELPKLANWTSFLQNILRHLAFGLTLGLLYRDEDR